MSDSRITTEIMEVLNTGGIMNPPQIHRAMPHGKEYMPSDIRKGILELVGIGAVIEAVKGGFRKAEQHEIDKRLSDVGII